MYLVNVIGVHRWLASLITASRGDSRPPAREHSLAGNRFDIVVCAENVKSGNSGDEVHRGWRVTE
jgi:hypothetical protein